METRVTIDNIQKWQNMKDGKPFEVIYLNTASGSYCAYPNTPGINLVGVGKTVVVHYKTNNYQGKEYRNIYRITSAASVPQTPPAYPTPPTHSTPSASPSQPTQPAQQMISFLADIKCLMETMLQNQSGIIATLKVVTDHLERLDHLDHQVPPVIHETQEPQYSHEPQETQDSQYSQEPDFDITLEPGSDGSDGSDVSNVLPF